ncbi:hypothetical protein BD414DRAFT_558084 [Trametes punicea]|nr:hypothetical protein BD414DRAFT_558084 [Trametes punicea]
MHWQGHSDDIHSVAWSSVGKRVASSSDDMTVRLWMETRTSSSSSSSATPPWSHYVNFSHNSRWLASGCAWDVTAGLPHKTLQGHQGML